MTLWQKKNVLVLRYYVILSPVFVCFFPIWQPTPSSCIAIVNVKYVLDLNVCLYECAGLSAAKLLRANGLTPVVLEARDRVGGRTFTARVRTKLWRWNWSDWCMNANNRQLPDIVHMLNPLNSSPELVQPEANVPVQKQSSVESSLPKVSNAIDADRHYNI